MTHQEIQSILDERGKKYGTFVSQANISQSLKRVIAKPMEGMADDQQEALSMIFHKIARIVNGDPDYVDSWVDIAGFATLVANRLGGRVE